MHIANLHIDGWFLGNMLLQAINIPGKAELCNSFQQMLRACIIWTNFPLIWTIIWKMCAPAPGKSAVSMVMQIFWKINKLKIFAKIIWLNVFAVMADVSNEKECIIVK